MGVTFEGSRDSGYFYFYGSKRCGSVFILTFIFLIFFLLACILFVGILEHPFIEEGNIVLAKWHVAYVQHKQLCKYLLQKVK